MAFERCCLARLILPSANQHITQCAAANSDSHRTRTVVPALRLTHITTTITDLYCRLTVISLQPFRKWTISREASGLAKKKHIAKQIPRERDIFVKLVCAVTLSPWHCVSSQSDYSKSVLPRQRPTPSPLLRGRIRESHGRSPLVTSHFYPQDGRISLPETLAPEVHTLNLKYTICIRSAQSAPEVHTPHLKYKLWT